MSGLPSTTSLVYLGDLQPAGPVKDGDQTFWCDSAACTAGIDLKRVTAAALAQYMLSRVGAAPPLQIFGNSLMLALDTSTLGITTGGALTVIGGGPGGEGGFPPGGTIGQLQVNAGALGFSGITLGGDATLNTGNGQLTLANTSGQGVWNQVTVDQKGRVTAGSNQPYLTANQSITLQNDVLGSGTTSIGATVVALQGRPVTNASPSPNQVLGWSGSSWTPQTIQQSGLTAPAGPLVSSDGNQLGSIALAGLELTGTFPNQTLEVLGPGGEPTVTPPGGGNGQIQWNNAGGFGGFTMGGDATLVASTGQLTLANSGVASAGTVQGITYDMKGRITGAVNMNYAPLAAPAFSGNPTVPNPTNNNSTQIANTAWVTGQLSALSIGVSQITATAPILVNQSTGAVAISMQSGVVTPNTVQGITFDTFGRITGAVNQGYLTANQPISLTQDVTGGPSSTLIASTVVALRGQPIAATTPTANQFLQYVGGQWTPQTVTLGGAGTVNLGQQGQIAGYPALGATVSGVSVSGDFTLSGETGVGRVTGLQNQPVSATAPTDGQVLTWSAGTAAWTPVTPTPGGPGGSLNMTGDISATGNLPNISALVVQLRGRAIANQTPQPNQVLAWSGSAWTPTPVAGVGSGFLPLVGGELTGPGDLIINQNTVSLPGGPFFTGTSNRQPIALQIGGADGQPSNIVFDGFGWQPLLHLRSTPGTAQNPTACVKDWTLGGITFHGHDGTNWTNGRGGIAMLTAEPWSTGHHGTYLNFSTAPPNTPAAFNTVFANTVMRLYQGLVLGNPPDDDPGYGALVGSDRIIVNKNAAPIAPPPQQGQELAHFAQADGQPARVTIDSFGWNSAVLLRAGKSPASANLPLVAGDVIGSYQFQGTVGDPASWFRSSAGISAIAVANFNTSNQPTRMDFYTSTNDQGPVATRMSLYKGLVIGNPAGGDLGYGTLNMDGFLSINGTVATFPTMPAGSRMHIAGEGFSRGFVSCFSLATTSPPTSGASWILRSARGTAAQPAALQTGDWLGLVGFGGYGSTDWVTGVSRRAAVSGLALQTWTDAAQGAELVFETTAVNANEPTIQARLGPGLQIGAPGTPSAAAMAIGDLNVQARIMKNGVEIGFPVSAGWVAGTDPSNIAVFVNNSGRNQWVSGMCGVVEVANGTNAFVDFYYAPPGTAIPNATTKLNGTAFNANGTPGQFQNLGPSGVAIGPNGGRIGLRVQAGATWTNSVATITVFLV